MKEGRREALKVKNKDDQIGKASVVFSDELQLHYIEVIYPKLVKKYSREDVSHEDIEVLDLTRKDLKLLQSAGFRLIIQKEQKG